MADGPEVLNVVYIDPDTAAESDLGQLELGPGGQLSLLDIEEPVEEFLTGLVESLNAKDAITVKTPGGRRYALGSKAYERSAPDFLEGLREYVRHYYSIELRSNRDLAAKPQEFEGLKA
jgi:hypothetical protein